MLMKLRSKSSSKLPAFSGPESPLLALRDRPHFRGRSSLSGNSGHESQQRPCGRPHPSKSGSRAPSQNALAQTFPRVAGYGKIPQAPWGKSHVETTRDRDCSGRSVAPPAGERIGSIKTGCRVRQCCNAGLQRCHKPGWGKGYPSQLCHGHVHQHPWNDVLLWGIILQNMRPRRGHCWTSHKSGRGLHRPAARADARKF
jgi:hypothetical protein